MSESEEMYLVTVALLVEAGLESPVPLSQLANELAIQPVSVNQMVRKLEDAGLVYYTPYKGAGLTPQGERLALRVLRHRRLWEVFLVECLNIPPASAAELACRLEHIVPDQAADSLARFLGEPRLSPLGKRIPAADAEGGLIAEMLLSQLKVGERSRVAQLPDDLAARAFLLAEGLQPGSELEVQAISGEGAMLVQVAGRKVYLGAPIAQAIWVGIPSLHEDQSQGDPGDKRASVMPQREH
ncbi:MAG TPA: metal-dependent transcriptional regulator [Anaerolineales bacterium]|nr:metal-dependent transcriptional regulator [Anaerolineales bacterium]